MPTQVVSWTAIPNGVIMNGHDISLLRVSVFVSPRLEINGESSSIRDFVEWLDWPSKINSMEFAVNFQNSTSLVKAKLDASRTNSLPSSVLWKSLFKETTTIRSHSDKYKDFSGVDREGNEYKIRTFSMLKNYEFLKNTYTSIAKNSPFEFPHVRNLVSLKSFGLIASAGRDAYQNESLADTEEKILFHIKEQLRSDKIVSPMKLQHEYGDRGHFIQLKHFHHKDKESKNNRVPITKIRKIADATEKAKAVKEIENRYDFHQLLSFLGQYPEIMRRLGLIIDLVVPATDIPLSNLTNPLWLEVSSESFRKTIDQPLKTLYLYDGSSSFITSPSKDLDTRPIVRDGMLRFDEKNEYQVIQIDVDSGIIKGNKLINKVIIDQSKKVLRKEKFVLSKKLEQQNLVLTPMHPELLKLNEKFKLINAKELPKQVIPKEVMEFVQANDIENLDKSDERGNRICVPPLRSEFISVVKNELAYDYSRKFDRLREINLNFVKKINQPTESHPDIPLEAQDLMRGYRIDVWDSNSGKWHSLCKRIGSYKVYDGTNPSMTINFSDEGWIQTGISQSKNNEELKKIDLSIHESLFKWQGWSLCARRPGKAIDPDDNIEEMGNTENELLTQLKLKVSFIAEPGTLPRLRFGRKYKFRARIVDLCGNSLELDQANDNHATDEFTFLRFEPVSSPVLLLKDELFSSESPGVSLERIRPGESLERIVIRTDNYDEHLDNVTATDEAIRHIAPPSTSQMLAEMHGMFDGASGRMKSDEIEYKEICKRQSTVENQEQGSFEKWCEPILSNGNTTSKPILKCYPINREDKVNLPYLSDPMVAGATFRNLPGTGDMPDTSGAVSYGEINTEGELKYKPETLSLPLSGNQKIFSLTKIDFGSKDEWPDMLPFRLVLIEPKEDEANLKPEWDANNRILKVKLLKGYTSTVFLSSYLDKNNNDIEKLGIHSWVPNTDPKLKTTALDGLHWMMTPFKEIVLVHAVKQPLGTPVFVDTIIENKTLPGLEVAERILGQTKALIKGKISINKESTQKVELNATWKENIDDPEQGNAPLIAVPHSAHVFEKNIMQSSTYLPNEKQKRMVLVPVQGYHFFADTKYRKVSYSIVSTSRFGEYFIHNPDDKIAFTRTTPDSLTKTLEILNAKKPDPPSISFIVPMFEWETSNNESMTNVRKGGGLRIYLERPWYSSGEGELLGVVVNANEALRSTILNPKFTHWGTDPIHSPSINISKHPGVNDFAGTDLKNRNVGLQIDESPEQKVAILGYEVHYDDKKSLWYTDIEIKSESYFPFVCLALVRYQPNSINEAHISTVVLSDFAQIVPTRIAEVKRGSPLPSKKTYSVTIKGNTANYCNLQYDIVSGGYDWVTSKDYTEIEVTVERSNGDSNGELAWEPINEGQQIQINEPKVVTVPIVPNAKFRLVVKEYEKYVTTDDGQYDQFLKPSDQAEKNSALDKDEKILKVHKIPPHQNFARVSRLVYLDIIDLSKLD